MSEKIWRIRHQPGDLVVVYQDPITRQHPEGSAHLVRKTSSDDEQHMDDDGVVYTLEQWAVRFPGEIHCLYARSIRFDEPMPRLVQIAEEVRVVYGEAATDLGPDLAGHSLLDLLADSFPHYSLRTLGDAIVIAGLGTVGDAPRGER